jgi:hypothetical protein
MISKEYQKHLLFAFTMATISFFVIRSLSKIDYFKEEKTTK